MEKEQVFIKKDTSQNWDGKTKLHDLPFINNSEYLIEDDILVINTKGGLF